MSTWVIQNCLTNGICVESYLMRSGKEEFYSFIKTNWCWETEINSFQEVENEMVEGYEHIVWYEKVAINLM